MIVITSAGNFVISPPAFIVCCPLVVHAEFNKMFTFTFMNWDSGLAHCVLVSCLLVYLRVRLFVPDV